MRSEKQQKAFEEIRQQCLANDSGRPEEGPIHKEVLEIKNKTAKTMKTLKERENTSNGC